MRTVIIPAHNEEVLLGGLLTALDELDPARYMIVVVANACTDETARVALGHRSIQVIELREASKVNAINKGLLVSPDGPVAVIDADIVISSRAVAALFDAVGGEDAVVASPSVGFITRGRPWIVKSFYRSYVRQPYVSSGPIGLGVYAFSRAARSQVGQFPNILADDAFARGALPMSQRRIAPDSSFSVRTPKTVSALIAVRTRVARGNQQYRVSVRGEGAQNDRRRLLDEPRYLLDHLVYAAVMVVARERARRGMSGLWERDESSRG